LDSKNPVLASNIKRIRLSLGETTATFGLRFGASRGLVSRWENGKVTPSPERLKQIAETGGMSIEYLLTGNKTTEDLPAEEARKINSITAKNTTVLAQQLKAFESSIASFSQKEISQMNTTQKMFLSQAARYILASDVESLVDLMASLGSMASNNPPVFQSQKELDDEKKDITNSFMNIITRYFSKAKINHQ
jgi:transcriptional regulator with XRE-family HTH domain